MSKIHQNIDDFKTTYEKSWYCNTNKLIHTNPKSYLKYPHCVSILDKMEYEAIQRLKWFIDGYYINNLGSLFTKLTTERICELYNVELKYFRPWI